MRSHWEVVYIDCRPCTKWQLGSFSFCLVFNFASVLTSPTHVFSKDYRLGPSSKASSKAFRLTKCGYYPKCQKYSIIIKTAREARKLSVCVCTGGHPADTTLVYSTKSSSITCAWKSILYYDIRVIQITRYVSMPQRHKLTKWMKFNSSPNNYLH